MSLKEQLESILADKRTNLLPSNIRIGKTVLGVKGTLPPPADNRTVKMFKTTEEMNNDVSPELDDLAVVYGKEVVDVTMSNFIELHLPQSITFDTAIEWNEVKGHIDNQNYYCEVRIMFDASRIYVDVYGSNERFRVQYESEDGLVYTTTQTELDYVSAVPLPMLEYMDNTEERRYDLSWLNAKTLYFSGVYKYNGSNYVAAPTQFSLSKQNQLMNNLIAYGSTGSVQGDGSYINNIPNADFIDRYVGESYSYSSKTAIQSGSTVKNQTFVEKLPYVNGMTITDNDAIAYSYVTDKVVSDYSTLEIFTTSWSRTTTDYIQHNDKLYYIHAGFIGTSGVVYNGTEWRNITKFGWALFNLTDGALVAHKVTSCSFNPIDYGSGAISSDVRYGARLQSVGYNFNNNTFYGLWYTTNSGLNAEFNMGITTYPKNGSLSHKITRHTNGWNYRTLISSFWNIVDNNFICRLNCWQSGQTSSYSIILLKITTDDVVTELITNTVEKGLYLYNDTNHYGRVVVVRNKADSNPVSKLFNTATKTYLGPIGTSNDYRCCAYGDNLVFVARDSVDAISYNIYTFNATNNTYSKIVENVPDGQIYVVLLNGEYKFIHNKIVYNTDGSIFEMKIPSNVSTYWTRIMTLTENVIQDIFSTNVTISSGKITTTNYTFNMALYRDISAFPINGILCLALSGKNSNTGSNTMYKYDSFELTASSYNDTITPDEYNIALETAQDILGKEETE